MLQRNRWVIVLLAIAGLGLTACTQKPVSDKNQPVELEQIEGSELKRLLLTEKAAERLDIQTVPIRDEQVGRKRMVGGEVVTSPLVPITGETEGASTSSSVSAPDNTNAEGIWVRVSLTKRDLDRVDRVQSAQVLPLDDDEATGWTAQEIEVPGVEDGEDEDTEETALYYVVNGSEQGLDSGQRVLVELPLVGSGVRRIVVPYSAVIYDVNGETWVYTNPEPLVFVRRQIVVDYIEGELAFLTVGPPNGTPVVTLGVAELFGAETGVSK